MAVFRSVPGIFFRGARASFLSSATVGGGGSGNAGCCGTRSRAVELQGVLRCKMRCIFLVGVGRVDYEGGVSRVFLTRR